jgi:microcystin-dependent protein
MMTIEIGNSNLIDAWAFSGTKTEASGAKKNTGWSPTEKPPSSEQNFLQNQADVKINHILLNGVPLWNATTPYIVGSTVNHSGRLYMALNATTNSTPSLVNANWVAIPLFTDTLGSSIGDIKMTSYATPDSGWALCNGQAVSRATYSVLFAKIGTTYGVGDGTTTFNLPQTENRFIQGAGSGRVVGTVQNETGTMSRDGWGNSNAPFGAGAFGRLVTSTGAGEIGESLESIGSAVSNGTVTNIKPTNIAFHYMIKIS